MIPSPWVSAVLVLGTFRIVRLIGWDEMPWIVRARAWLGGRNERNRGVAVFVEDARGTFTRPTVARFLACAWCQGFWLAAAMYVTWVYAPTAALYVAAPFALSAAVGLIARHLDP